MKYYIGILTLVLIIFAGATVAMAGAVGGPKKNNDTVSAHDRDTYFITFKGKESAEVLVTGDGSTDLDCAAYDNNGNMVAKDIDPGDTCYLSWSPRWTGKFRIMIVNLGNTDNEYQFRTN